MTQKIPKDNISFNLVNEMDLLRALKYGLLIGGLNVVIYGFIYQLNMSLIFSGWIQILINLLNIVLYTLSAFQIRSYHEKNFSFWWAFGLVFTVLLISGFIFIIFQYLQFNVVNPDLVNVFKEQQIAQTKQTLEYFNMENDQIENEIAQIKNGNPFGLLNLMWSFFLNSILGGALLALIIAVFVKKKQKLLS